MKLNKQQIIKIIMELYILFFLSFKASALSLYNGSIRPRSFLLEKGIPSPSTLRASYLIRRNSEEGLNEWLPRSKKEKKQRPLAAWNMGREVWIGYSVLSAGVLVLCAFSAVHYALPGVRAALGSKKAPSAIKVWFDSVLLGRCVNVKRRSVAILGLLSGSNSARLRLHGTTVSTQSPLLSDLALDRGNSRLTALLTHAVAHGSLSHLCFDIVALRFALLSSEAALLIRASSGPRLDPSIRSACGSSLNLGLLFIIGAYVSGLAHLRYSRSPRALGLSGVVAALHGARLVARVRLRTPTKFAIFLAFRDLAILIVGGVLTGGVPVALTNGGFAAGLLLAFATSPRFYLVQADPSSFVLRGDARDAERRKKARALAPRLADTTLHQHDSPLIPFWMTILLIGLFSNSDIFRAIGRLPASFYTMAKQPGQLSGRTLYLPPRLSFF
uniref:Peptidase S54 rhomboid domain-containing protein n=1 Tax=Aureoumbra lagunensis TaxID=44058 RepID=A0A7S3K531_9STRA|mmetsp:Transcript_12877/g.19297  ORF Transcript_12877/g.19297 Transcript_12877/m.19297 type:complete len:443 (-) Transcript_12877:271-1599(-)